MRLNPVRTYAFIVERPLQALPRALDTRASRPIASGVWIAHWRVSRHGCRGSAGTRRKAAPPRCVSQRPGICRRPMPMPMPMPMRARGRSWSGTRARCLRFSTRSRWSPDRPKPWMRRSITSSAARSRVRPSSTARSIARTPRLCSGSSQREDAGSAHMRERQEGPRRTLRRSATICPRTFWWASSPTPR